MSNEALLLIIRKLRGGHWEENQWCFAGVLTLQLMRRWKSAQEADSKNFTADCDAKKRLSHNHIIGKVAIDNIFVSLHPGPFYSMGKTWRFLFGHLMWFQLCSDCTHSFWIQALKKLLKDIFPTLVGEELLTPLKISVEVDLPKVLRTLLASWRIFSWTWGGFSAWLLRGGGVCMLEVRTVEIFNGHWNSNQSQQNHFLATSRLDVIGWYFHSSLKKLLKKTISASLQITSMSAMRSPKVPMRLPKKKAIAKVLVPSAETFMVSMVS